MLWNVQSREAETWIHQVAETHVGSRNVLGLTQSFLVLVKILVGIVVSDGISIAGRIIMAVVDLQCIDLCRASHRLSGILLEEQLESNVVLVKEVCVVQDWTIIKCVSRFAACSTGLSGIKVFVGSCCIDTTVLQTFEVIKAR